MLAQSTLEKRNTFVHDAMRHAPAILYVLDATNDRRAAFIGPNVEALTGHRPEAFLAKADYFLDTVHPDDRAGYLKALDAAEANGTAAVEYRLRTAAGETLRVRDEVTLAAGSDDRRRLVGCMVPLTSETPSGDPSGRLAHALDCLPCGFALYDENDRVVHCNAAFAALYGVGPRDLIGLSSHEILRRAESFCHRVKDWSGRERGGREMPSLTEVGVAPSVDHYEMETADGRWFLVRAHRTTDGGFAILRTEITRQKHFEVSLRDSEAVYAAIIRSTMDSIVATDEAGRVVEFNPAAEQTFGYGRAEAIGRPIAELIIAPEYRRGAAAQMPQMLETGAPIALERRTEIKAMRAGGSQFPAELTVSRVELDGRRVFTAVLRDITEQKRARRERKHLIEMLREAIESIPGGFAMFDAEHRLVMCNTAYASYCDSTPDRLDSMAMIDLYRCCLRKVRAVDGEPLLNNAVDAEQFGERLQDLLRKPVELELLDGEWILVQAHETADGGIVMIRTDITRLKAAEASLREREQHYRRIVEGQPAPVWMVDVESGRILYASPAASAVMGTPLNFESGIYAQDFYANPEDRKEIVRILRERGEIIDHDLQLKRADGSVFWATATCRRVELDGREVVISSFIDLTERRAAEAELARQREVLYQSEKLSALGSLLAGVAHELNNPLSVVVGQALLLRETARDPQITQRAAKIGGAADRCARIVKSFLAMARQRPPERSYVDLNALIESILEMIGYSLRTQRIEVAAELAPALPPVWADADQINQVLMNLIVNAQQAVLEVAGTRRISIATRYDALSGSVRVVVADNGPGISDEIRSRIFEPFFTTKEVGLGTGVGLAVSYGIVEAHDGTLRAENADSTGARFTVSLPRAVPDPAQRPAGIETAAPVGRRQILIVDDEAEIAQTLREILLADGHGVEIAESGSAAHAMILSRRFDVVLCDVRMPELDGPGLFGLLKRENPELLDRLAFITGDTFGLAAGAFLEGTGLPYLEKPFTPAEVRHLVERVVAARRETA